MACNNTYHLHFAAGRDSRLALETFLEIADAIEHLALPIEQTLPPNGLARNYQLSRGLTSLTLLPSAPHGPRTIVLAPALGEPLDMIITNYPFTHTSDPHAYFAAQFSQEVDELERAFRDAAQNAFGPNR